MQDRKIIYAKEIEIEEEKDSLKVKHRVQFIGRLNAIENTMAFFYLFTFCIFLYLGS